MNIIDRIILPKETKNLHRINELAKKFGVPFKGKDQKVTTWLRKQGQPSLAKCLEMTQKRLKK